MSWKGPDYIPEHERAEYVADYVMQDIEALVESEARGHERSFWVLEHMYELHKMRDERVFQGINDLIIKLPVEALGPVLAAHVVMYKGY